MASPAPRDTPAKSPTSLLNLPNELLERIAAMVPKETRFQEDELKQLSGNGKALRELRGACKRTAAICRGVAFQVRLSFQLCGVAPCVDTPFLRPGVAGVGS